MMVTTNIQKYP